MMTQLVSTSLLCGGFLLVWNFIGNNRGLTVLGVASLIAGLVTL